MEHATLDDLIVLTQDRLAAALRVTKTEKSQHDMNLREVTVLKETLAMILFEKRMGRRDDDGE